MLPLSPEVVLLSPEALPLSPEMLPLSLEVLPLSPEVLPLRPEVFIPEIVRFHSVSVRSPNVRPIGLRCRLSGRGQDVPPRRLHSGRRVRLHESRVHCEDLSQGSLNHSLPVPRDILPSWRLTGRYTFGSSSARYKLVPRRKYQGSGTRSSPIAQRKNLRVVPGTTQPGFGSA